ncbi:hypothetical protein BDQ17DRAFT_1321031 [Cyathus striatus]|nr:hypothetical protein BDQ17DRAFT_1321031 [Cyathus striatus]
MLEITWEAAQREAIAQDISLLQTLDIFQYVNFAFMTVLFYDHALTFDAELKVIWTFELILCTIYSSSPELPIVISMTSVEILLLNRVMAIYHNNKVFESQPAIAKLLVFTFRVEMLVWIGVFLYNVIITKGIPGGTVFRGCVYYPPKYYYFAWIPPLIFESALFILIIYGVKKWDGSFSSLLQTVTRDAIIYFLFSLGSIAILFIYPLVTNLLTAVLPLFITLNTSGFSPGWETRDTNAHRQASHFGRLTPLIKGNTGAWSIGLGNTMWVEREIFTPIDSVRPCYSQLAEISPRTIHLGEAKRSIATYMKSILWHMEHNSYTRTARWFVIHWRLLVFGDAWHKILLILYLLANLMEEATHKKLSGSQLAA